MGDRLRIVVADDHPIVRSGIRAICAAEAGMKVVAEAATVDDAAAAAAASRPDVVVLDLQMPGGGLDAIRRLRECAPARVLVLTMHDDPASVSGAFKAGATGYLVKRASSDQIVEAIRTVAAGKRFVDPALGMAEVPKIDDEHSRIPPAALSGRERQVLELVARGYTNKEVADQLAISVKSVETYRSRVLDKLDLRSRAELVRYALEHGLLESSNPPPADRKG